MRIYQPVSDMVSVGLVYESKLLIFKFFLQIYILQHRMEKVQSAYKFTYKPSSVELLAVLHLWTPIHRKM
jgi:hypothetical protein